MRRHFGIFWLVQTLSVAGDMFSLVAVPLLVLAATGSIAQMGLLTGASGVGRILAGLFAGLGQSDGTVGYVLASSGIGTVIAALLVARARRRLGFGACWIGANALGGITLVLVGAAPPLIAMAAIATAFAFASTIGSICSLSLRQEVTPNHLLGRVTAAFWTIHYSLAPFGAAGLTAAAGHFGVPAVCLAVGAGCVLVALAAALTPIRLARPESLAVEYA